MRTKTTAAILAFFLGGLGFHKFYLGQTGIGILYLIFCWTWVPAIISFFEAISLLTYTEKSFNEKFNAGAISQELMNTTQMLNNQSLQQLQTLQMMAEMQKELASLKKQA